MSVNEVSNLCRVSGDEPKIWREFEISGADTMAELTFAVMSMFRAEGEYLFFLNVYQMPDVSIVRQRFTQKHLRQLYSTKNRQEAIVYELSNDPSIHFYQGKLESDLLTIEESLRQGMLMLLQYDFGDSWEIAMQVRKLDDAYLDSQPKIMAGEGYGIIEDVGGIWGLMNLEAALRDEVNDNRQYYLEWLGLEEFEEFSIEDFDIDELNARLKGEIEYFSQLCKRRFS